MVLHFFDPVFVTKQLAAWGIMAGLTGIFAGAFRWSLPAERASEAVVPSSSS